MPGAYTFALTVQLLQSRSDQVLALAELHCAHAAESWFRPVDVLNMYSDFRIPPPGNIHQVLADLSRKGLVRKGVAPGVWAVAPLGQDSLRRLGLDLQAGAVERTVNQSVGGAMLGHVRHPVVPPFLAPPQWLRGIDRFLAGHPFEANVFCMTRFPRSDVATDANRLVIDTTREVLAQHGLELHLASDRQIVDDLYGNVAAFMWSSMYGLGLFETRVDLVLNHNVVIEVGSMLMTGRRCALLKDAAQHVDMPTDFVGYIYKPVAFDDATEVSSTVHRWAADDLGLGRCAKCPV